MASPFNLLYWDEPTLWSAAISIILAPVYWILISQLEYHTHILRRIFCSRYVAAFIFSITVIIMLAHRNMRFLVALQHQPKWPPLQENPILWLGHTLTILGFLMVIRSFLSLGFINTHMGDYFGLCLPQRVRSFPYSWMNHPMYTGSFFMFLGIAIADTSQAGLLLALLAGLMYLLAALWEQPFTDRFYASCSKSTRTVGVQVSCTSQLLEIAARTVAAQTGGEVEIISGPELANLQVEIEEVETVAAGGEVYKLSATGDCVLAASGKGSHQNVTEQGDGKRQSASGNAGDDSQLHQRGARRRNKNNSRRTEAQTHHNAETSNVEFTRSDLEKWEALKITSTAEDKNKNFVPLGSGKDSGPSKDRTESNSVGVPADVEPIVTETVVSGANIATEDVEIDVSGSCTGDTGTEDTEATVLGHDTDASETSANLGHYLSEGVETVSGTADDSQTEGVETSNGTANENGPLTGETQLELDQLDLPKPGQLDLDQPRVEMTGSEADEGVGTTQEEPIAEGARAENSTADIHPPETLEGAEAEPTAARANTQNPGQPNPYGKKRKKKRK